MQNYDPPKTLRHKARKLAACAYNLAPQFIQNKINSEFPKVLMYHRVVDPAQLSWELESGMFVTPESFAMQMEVLKNNFNVISTEELVLGLSKKKKLPAKSVSITFDDGWRDTFDNALPVLKSLKLPADVFVATNFIETNQLFWTDKVAIAFSTEPLKVHELLQKFGAFTPQTSKNPDPIFSEKNFNLESAIFLLKAASFKNRMKVVDALEPLIDYPNRQFMNWSEVKELTTNNISIGSHTHSHRFSTEMSSEELAQDLELSKKLILEKTESKTNSLFCYPNGDYNNKTQVTLKQFSFSAALSVHRNHLLDKFPPVIGRIGIHQDISYSEDLFVLRLA